MSINRVSDIYMSLLYDITYIYRKNTSKNIEQNFFIYNLIVLFKFFICSKGFRVIAIYRLTRYMHLGNHKLLVTIQPPIRTSIFLPILHES